MPSPTEIVERLRAAKLLTDNELAVRPAWVREIFGQAVDLIERYMDDEWERKISADNL